MIRSLGAAVLLLVCLGCQPADEPSLSSIDAAEGEAVSSDDVVGAPARGMPQTLGGLLERSHVPAREWQPDPKVAEVWVNLDEEGRAARARMTYLGPDADRFLVVRIDGEGLSLEQPTLETLELPPVTAAGLEDVPDLPPDALAPTELAAAAGPALEACDVGPPVQTIVYATGAPMSWDGQRWTEDPVWTASVITADGGAVVDPVDGTAVGSCFSG